MLESGVHVWAAGYKCSGCLEKVAVGIGRFDQQNFKSPLNHLSYLFQVQIPVFDPRIPGNPG